MGDGDGKTSSCAPNEMRVVGRQHQNNWHSGSDQDPILYGAIIDIINLRPVGSAVDSAVGSDVGK